MTEYFGDNIAYTKGDSFYLEITSEDGFSDGDILEFSISPSERSKSTIFKRIPQEDGKFKVTFCDEDIEKLSINEYLYKISLVSENGGRITHKSGQFTVKWGE